MSFNLTCLSDLNPNEVSKNPSFAMRRSGVQIPLGSTKLRRSRDFLPLSINRAVRVVAAFVLHLVLPSHRSLRSGDGDVQKYSNEKGRRDRRDAKGSLDGQGIWPWPADSPWLGERTE